MKRLFPITLWATLLTALPITCGSVSLLVLLMSDSLAGLFFIPGALLLMGPAVSYWRRRIIALLQGRESEA